MVRLPGNGVALSRNLSDTRGPFDSLVGSRNGSIVELRGHYSNLALLLRTLPSIAEGTE